MPEIDFISLGVMGGHGRPWAAMGGHGRPGPQA